MLFDEDSQLSFNEILVNTGRALKVGNKEAPLCLSYPSFSMLERLAVYPSFGERDAALRKDVDFNDFEEKYIPPVTNAFGFEAELAQIFNNGCFDKEKSFLLKLREN